MQRKSYHSRRPIKCIPTCTRSQRAMWVLCIGFILHSVESSFVITRKPIHSQEHKHKDILCYPPSTCTSSLSTRTIRIHTTTLCRGNEHQEKSDSDDNDNNDDKTLKEHLSCSFSRRSMIQGIVTVAAAAASNPSPSFAAKPEIDTTGELYSPKRDMLSGGSQAARGLQVQQKRGEPLKPGQALQTVYNARFIAYLTRFLLVYDQAASAWWLKEGFAESWDQFSGTTDDSKSGNSANKEELARFAEFAESVEVGLADYFVGPYGSYSSVAAARAGLSAAAPVKSARQLETQKFLSATAAAKALAASDALAAQGVLNLCALLQARYTSVEAKRQLALLFSLVESPGLQPIKSIEGLLGEADNATVTTLDINRYPAEIDELTFRDSGNRGGGYSMESSPKISIDQPSALGSSARRAEAKAVMQPTSRVLRIQVVDGGEGYINAPQVTVTQGGVRKPCDACAILDRQGRVESILVLDPGYGYGGTAGTVPPIVTIASRKGKRFYTDKSSNSRKEPKQLLYRDATAIVDLEYEIADITLIKGGAGYALTEPPKVNIAPPEADTDWYVQQKSVGASNETASFKVKACNMKGSAINKSRAALDDKIIGLLRREPLELIPSSIRPMKGTIVNQKGDFLFTIPNLPPLPKNVKLPSAMYRAYDPIFGGIGIVPVTKGAKALKFGEYSRIAFSGAVCTVLVRTLLNPLELVKTKIQLENDEELSNFAITKMKKSIDNEQHSPTKKLDETDEIGQGYVEDSITEEQQFLKKGTNMTPDSMEEHDAEHFSEEESVTVQLKEKDTQEQHSEKRKESKTILPRAENDAEGSSEVEGVQAKVGTGDMLSSIIELRGPLALFQSADITFLASLVFGGLGFGAVELFRRSFSAYFFSAASGEGGKEVILLVAAVLSTAVTSFVAAPFETLRVRSMALVEPQGWTEVLQDLVESNRVARKAPNAANISSSGSKKKLEVKDIKPDDVAPLFSGFTPIVSRELPFAVTKFLAFDLIGKSMISLLNAQSPDGALPLQVGVGTIGLIVSAAAGAIAGIIGAFVSHPADLILTLTSTSKKKSSDDANLDDEEDKPDWKEVVKNLLAKEGGIANLYVGLPARSTFFFLVIGLQFFFYDYVKNLFNVSTDDLSLVLDVFYAVRQGLVGTAPSI